MPKPKKGASPRRVGFAPEGDPRQPGHRALRARPDHHHRGQGHGRCGPYAEKLITHAKAGTLAQPA